MHVWDEKRGDSLFKFMVADLFRVVLTKKHLVVVTNYSLDGNRRYRRRSAHQGLERMLVFQCRCDLVDF